MPILGLITLKYTPFFLRLLSVLSFAQEQKGKGLPFYKLADTPPMGWNN